MGSSRVTRETLPDRISPIFPELRIGYGCSSPPTHEEQYSIDRQEHLKYVALEHHRRPAVRGTSGSSRIPDIYRGVTEVPQRGMLLAWGATALLLLPAPPSLAGQDRSACSHPQEAAALLEDVLPLFSDTTADALEFQESASLDVVVPGDAEVVSDPVVCAQITQRVREWFGTTENPPGRTGYSVIAVRVGSYYAAYMLWHWKLTQAVGARSSCFLKIWIYSPIRCSELTRADGSVARHKISLRVHPNANRT
jgi:hypothetical protein